MDATSGDAPAPEATTVTPTTTPIAPTDATPTAPTTATTTATSSTTSTSGEESAAAAAPDTTSSAAAVVPEAIVGEEPVTAATAEPRPASYSDGVIPPPRIPKRLVRLGPFKSGEKFVRNLRSNHIIALHDISDACVVIATNQKLAHISVVNAENATVQVLDSVVIGTDSCEFANFNNCYVFFDMVLLRTIRCHNVKNTVFQFDDSPTLVDNTKIIWDTHCCGNSAEIVQVKPGTNPNTVVKIPTEPLRRYAVQDFDATSITTFAEDLKSLTTRPYVQPENCNLLGAADRTLDTLLHEQEEQEKANSLVSAIPYDSMGLLYEQEIAEYTESSESITLKAQQVAQAMREARHCVFFTGAGVSTAASIPDYRGPDGCWTARARGELFRETPELESAFPTYTHYAIAELLRKGLVKFLISTNLDGLHRRSGVQREQISELHGNCYREYCVKCHRDYLRPFNTLHSRTDRWTHLTGRKCDCGGDLRDTIVHFTENMPEDQFLPAIEHARRSDLSVILGTSMNVQPAASLCDKCLKNPNGKLALVNIQHTPCDRFCTFRIYSRTDEFMAKLMAALSIDTFDQKNDLLDQMRKEAKKVKREETIRCRLLFMSCAAIVAAFLCYLVWFA
ncbi:silent information regulator family protein [Pelomyxa schiedti]|nr:silent information regulator family protein [Pelomyxa schiedti]